MEIYIPGPAGRLEAVFWPAPKAAHPKGACAVCHPHPSYGGTMNSSVVFRVARGLQQAGVCVLRFNFRGVGKSEGEHDDGRGEGDDLGAALDWLAREQPGLELWAGGFSFGARIAAQRAIEDERVARVVLIALTVAKIDSSFVRRLTKPGLIMMAGNDEYGTLAQLKAQFPDLDPRLELDEIADTGHFFEGATQELSRRVRAWAERTLERNA